MSTTIPIRHHHPLLPSEEIRGKRKLATGLDYSHSSSESDQSSSSLVSSSSISIWLICDGCGSQPEGARPSELL